MDVRGTRAVVVGGGIGGLAAGLLLTRLGARVTLLERRDALGEVGAGLLLQPAGLAVLAGLGLGPEVARAGLRFRRSVVRGARGQVIARLRTRDAGPGLDGVVACRRQAVHGALLDAALVEPSLEVRTACAVQRVDRTGRVEVTDDRRGGQASVVQADLLVGADGVRSVVRDGLDVRAVVRPTGHRYLRVLTPVEPGAELLAGERWTSLGLIGGAQVDDATTNLYASATAPAVRRALDRRDLPALREAWGRELPVAERVLWGVASVDDLLVDDIVRVDCERWVDGRAALLGDAAHAMEPTLGAGASSALVDAAVLAAELRSAATVEEALAAYDTRRRPVVAQLADRADLVARMAHVATPLGRTVRDLVLAAVSLLPGSADRAARAVQQEDPAALLATVAAVSALARR